MASLDIGLSAGAPKHASHLNKFRAALQGRAHAPRQSAAASDERLVLCGVRRNVKCLSVQSAGEGVSVNILLPPNGEHAQQR